MFRYLCLMCLQAHKNTPETNASVNHFADSLKTEEELDKMTPDKL